jgi:hypothetical protein
VSNKVPGGVFSRPARIFSAVRTAAQNSRRRAEKSGGATFLLAEGRRDIHDLAMVTFGSLLSGGSAMNVRMSNHHWAVEKARRESLALCDAETLRALVAETESVRQSKVSFAAKLTLQTINGITIKGAA